MMHRFLGLATVLCVAAVVGCADKAKPSFDECVKAEGEGDLARAAQACDAAVKADPDSASGKAAAEKLTAVRTAIEAAAKQAKEKAEAEAARAAKERAATEQAADRTKLLASTSPDDWKTLVAKYPDSGEAKEAGTKLRLSQPFCASPGPWLDEATNDAKELEAVQPELKAFNKGKSTIDIMKHLSEVGRAAEKRADVVRARASDLKRAPKGSGGDAARTNMLADYDAIAKLNDEIAKAGKDAKLEALVVIFKNIPAFASSVRKDGEKIRQMCSQ